MSNDEPDGTILFANVPTLDAVFRNVAANDIILCVNILWLIEVLIAT